MKKYSYIIVDDDAESILKTQKIAGGFSELTFLASAANFHDGLHLTLEYSPSIVFLEIHPKKISSGLSLAFISELNRFLTVLPRIIITTAKKDLAFEAIQHGVFDYLLKPLSHFDFLKMVLKLNKTFLDIESADFKKETFTSIISHAKVRNTSEEPLIICIKSYGDYRYINASDITYFQADNNSTDIYLNSGEMVTAFKTLKHFESLLSYPFFRIHNSYIINRNYISRIHSGNSVCYIKNSPKKIPFSKTYKSNIDIIIIDFTTGNYIEV